MTSTHYFETLLAFMKRLPAIQVFGSEIPHGTFENGNWWIKFAIDTEHPLAWRHVQELGFVLNYVSIEERLPTVFMPVSPPPYLNGGVEFLSWVLESTSPEFSPDDCARWLEGRLPRPVEDLALWDLDEDDESESSSSDDPNQPRGA